jgi:hypothetical protein
MTGRTRAAVGRDLTIRGEDQGATNEPGQGYGARARREPATVGTTVSRMIVRLGLEF